MSEPLGSREVSGGWRRLPEPLTVEKSRSLWVSLTSQPTWSPPFPHPATTIALRCQRQKSEDKGMQHSLGPGARASWAPGSPWSSSQPHRAGSSASLPPHLPPTMPLCLSSLGWKLRHIQNPCLRSPRDEGRGRACQSQGLSGPALLTLNTHFESNQPLAGPGLLPLLPLRGTLLGKPRRFHLDCGTL